MKNGKWTAGASVFKAQNIVSVPATTHIMSNATYQTFVSYCLLPLLPRRALLLHDSWSCFRNEEAQLIKADRKKLELLQIPPHCTRHVQPLDVYFFQQWKAYKKRFDDCIVAYDVNVNLILRDRELKLQSIIHNQFSAPKFKNMIAYAWHKAGFYEQHPGEFEIHTKFCFARLTVCSACADESFARCSHCQQEFCFAHFYLNYHTHF